MSVPIKRECIHYLYLDTETTGLLPTDQMYEIAWQFETLFVDDLSSLLHSEYSHYLQHTVPRHQVSRYTAVGSNYRRWNDTPVKDLRSLASSMRLLTDQIHGHKLSGPIYIVGSNPHFDMTHIEPFFNEETRKAYNHQIINLAAYEMGYSGRTAPLGLEKLYRTYIDPDFTQWHNAAADVQAVRTVFSYLRSCKRLCVQNDRVL